MSWIDVHTHINMLEDSPEAAVQNAVAAGVERLITIGTATADHPIIIDLVEKFQPTVYGTLGYHPLDAKEFSAEGEVFLRTNLVHPGIVAVGEIGLDYHYEHSPRETQKTVFRKQMQIASQMGLPVEIHTREAEEDTIAILREFPDVTGLIHCFTGSRWLADQALALGYNISFSGVITFKNGDELREVVRSVPLDRIHVETDAPFLTPVPLRGKKNAPQYIVHTAEVIAKLKNVSLEELAQATKSNAVKMFKKLKWN